MSHRTVPGCPLDMDGDPPYRSCIFAQNEDVSAFWRGRGLFEVRYCFEGPLCEELNIWSDTQAQ